MEDRPLNDFSVSMPTEEHEQMMKAKDLWVRAQKKAELITLSKAIPYMVAGGGIERSNDLKQAQKVLERVYEYYKKKRDIYYEAEREFLRGAKY